MESFSCALYHFFQACHRIISHLVFSYFQFLFSPPRASGTCTLPKYIPILYLLFHDYNSITWPAADFNGLPYVGIFCDTFPSSISISRLLFVRGFILKLNFEVLEYNCDTQENEALPCGWNNLASCILRRYHVWIKLASTQRYSIIEFAVHFRTSLLFFFPISYLLLVILAIVKYSHPWAFSNMNGWNDRLLPINLFPKL